MSMVAHQVPLPGSVTNESIPCHDFPGAILLMAQRKSITSSGDDMNEEKRSEPVVAILLGDDFDEWLDTLGMSLKDFSQNMIGSWVFNYVQALQVAGVRPVIYCISTQVSAPTRLIHYPTGGAMVVLPPSNIYQIVKQWLPGNLDSVDGQHWHGASSSLLKRARKRILLLIKWYLSTPLFVLFSELRRDDCRSLLVQEYESARFDLCVLFGRLKQVRVFGTYTGALPTRWFTRPLRRLGLGLCAGLVICARCEAKRVMARYAVPADKVALIYFPLDFSVWYPSNKEESRALIGILPDARVAMYHGATLIRYKGLDVLLDAWERICQDRPGRDLRLILIGTGADSAKFSQMLATKRLRGVQWLNQWIHDRGLIQRYLSAADVYVFPSRGDGFGVSVIEAMACGVSVVASRVNGIPDILPQGEQSCGMLVPSGDVDALTREVGRLLDDPALARELGRRARRRTETSFSMEAIGKQLSAFLLNGRQ